MSHLFRAGLAFILVSLMTGHGPVLSLHWRAVAAELDRAEPETRLKTAALALFHREKG